MYPRALDPATDGGGSFRGAALMESLGDLISLIVSMPHGFQLHSQDELLLIAIEMLTDSRFSTSFLLLNLQKYTKHF